MAIQAPPVGQRHRYGAPPRLLARHRKPWLDPDNWVDGARWPMSEAEYDALPLDGRKLEWVDGEAIVIAPNFAHNEVIARLCYSVITSWPEARVIPGSELTYRMRKRIPDLMIIDPMSAETTRATEPPLVVVEVLSLSTWREDLEVKAAEYAAFGIRQYWIADPEVASLTIKENVSGAWRTAVVLDATHPTIDVMVAGHTITLNRSQLFT